MEIENNFIALKDHLNEISQQYKEYYMLQQKQIEDEHHDEPDSDKETD
jgi:hypothetical protein